MNENEPTANIPSQERARKWAAIEDAIRTHYNYHMIKNPTYDLVYPPDIQLNEKMAAWNGKIVGPKSEGDNLIIKYGDAYIANGGAVDLYDVSQILNDAWKEMYNKLIKRSTDAHPTINLLESNSKWEKLAFHTVLKNLRICFDHLPPSDLPDPPEEGEEPAARQEFVRAHMIENLFSPENWKQIKECKKTVKDFLEGKLNDLVKEDKSDILQEMGVASLTLNNPPTINSINSNNNSKKEEEGSKGTQNTGLKNTTNNNIIESPSQNPPPKTDTFTRTTKRVNNASPKDQDWHLSTDWECVTVW